jgi:hypothetical protein
MNFLLHKELLVRTRFLVSNFESYHYDFAFQVHPSVDIWPESVLRMIHSRQLGARSIYSIRHEEDRRGRGMRFKYTQESQIWHYIYQMGDWQIVSSHA